ncbi:unnamed protein product [Rangifer tarandus platyrhynchus]|uniref:Uncharacterized protein n=2 Tax=Rangifer tarandus platyrhynchus TaxID=3082113 RepID=A0ABN8YQY7_RANTA|nr:unnamed protein product [Rangifer tarandus platyrhynchus]
MISTTFWLERISRQKDVPAGIFHQLESKDIGRHTDGRSRTCALGRGCVSWPVILQQRLKGYPASAALSSSSPVSPSPAVCTPTPPGKPPPCLLAQIPRYAEITKSWSWELLNMIHSKENSVLEVLHELN